MYNKMVSKCTTANCDYIQGYCSIDTNIHSPRNVLRHKSIRNRNGFRHHIASMTIESYRNINGYSSIKSNAENKMNYDHLQCYSNDNISTFFPKTHAGLKVYATYINLFTL